MVNDEDKPLYDRSSDGWTIPWVKTVTELDDGTKVTTTHAARSIARPPEERVRCGPYKDPRTGSPCWGDHRVTIPGTTCEEVDCHVPHAVHVVPGWSEKTLEGENYYKRSGIKPVAAALEGWDAGSILPRPIGSSIAWVAASVVLDALRDAGYTLVRTGKDPFDDDSSNENNESTDEE